MQNDQYFVNLQDLISSFTTKEVLCRCFTEAKVISYTTFFESTEQLLFGTTSYLTYLHIRKTAAQQPIACSRSAIQKLDKLRKTYKVYSKDKFERISHLILVFLLLNR